MEGLAYILCNTAKKVLTIYQQ